jgi:hypothetical protein
MAERWLAVAREMTVSLDAGVERVDTDCGPREAAFAAESRPVKAREVDVAEALLARLKAPAPLSTSSEASASELRPGAWVEDFRISTFGPEPDIWDHYFIAVTGDGKYIGGGAILTGGKWDRSDVPGWAVVHGRLTTTPMGYAFLEAAKVAYLGPSWDPAYADLSATLEARDSQIYPNRKTHSD